MRWEKNRIERVMGVIVRSIQACDEEKFKSNWFKCVCLSCVDKINKLLYNCNPTSTGVAFLLTPTPAPHPHPHLLCLSLLQFFFISF